MKALLLTEYKHLEVTDMDVPACGADDLLVRVQSCGICGSDVHGYDGSTGRRVPPLVMGHEAAGVVEQVGTNVTRFRSGDRVTFDSTVSCGKCHFCLRGHINLCDNRMVLGVSCGDYRRHGCFAEYVVVPQHISYPLPEALSFDHAALIEAVSVAVHAANRTPVAMGGTAVVVGSGMIGLLTIQAIKLKGCSRILAVDLEDNKLELAQTLGAEVGLNPKHCDVIAEIKRLTGGRGADVALEVVGATATVKTAIESVRKGGSVTLIGNLSPQVEFPLQSVVTREISIYGSCASNGEYPECIELLSRGLMDVAPLISARATLDEGPAWFQRLYAGEAGLMKVILQPNA